MLMVKINQYGHDVFAVPGTVEKWTITTVIPLIQPHNHVISVCSVDGRFNGLRGILRSNMLFPIPLS